MEQSIGQNQFPTPHESTEKSVNSQWNLLNYFINKFTYLIKEIIMGKGKDSKKATKKAPTKTAKEKRAEKKLKKANRD